MSKDLTLRTVEESDIEFLHRLYNDPNVMLYWFEEAYYSKEKIRTNLEKYLEDENSRRFILHNGTEQLGFIALYDIDYTHRKAEFAIMIDPKQQGKGYAIPATKLAMDYAFRTLNLNKLYLIVDKENEIAMKVYEKVGFQKEAVLKDEYFVNGSYHSIVYMSCFQANYLTNE